MSNTGKRYQTKGPQICSCEFCQGCHRVSLTLKDAILRQQRQPTALSVVDGQDADRKEECTFSPVLGSPRTQVTRALVGI